MGGGSQGPRRTGTSTRAGRNLPKNNCPELLLGNIHARGEEPDDMAWLRELAEEHPRARGGTRSSGAASYHPDGTSTRAGRNPPSALTITRIWRNIHARGEEPRPGIRGPSSTREHPRARGGT